MSSMPRRQPQDPGEGLRSAHDAFHHLVANSPFGVYVIDRDFRLIQVSAGAQQVFQNVRPLLGRDFAEVLRIVWPEPFASEAIDRFRHTLETGESYAAPSTTERRQDVDAVESYDWRIERIVLPDGRLGVVCHFYDLSERQRYEAALRESDRQKDEFLAILAHELRNPLAPIRTSITLLRGLGSTDPQVIRWTDVIDRQTTHMARLLDDLLDVSRLSRGTLSLQRSVLPVADVLDAAVETSRPIIERHRCSLRCELPPPNLLVHGDLARLTQVFANLLNNAAKYNVPGGEIVLAAHRSDDGAVVTVRDTGIGLSLEFIERAFDLFSQASGPHDQGGGGLGIGLALARRLVELHGGTIRATSAGPGAGSEFTVCLPAAAAESHMPSSTAGHGSATGPLRARVLLAEDNQDAADMLETLLTHRGCEVRTVRDGSAAVEQAEAFRPDVVVLDLGLPVLDGNDACRRIRSQPWSEGMRIVALTGWGQEEDRRRTASAGFDRHLVKPVDPERLIAVLRELLSSRP